MTSFDNEQGAGWIDPARLGSKLGFRSHALHFSRGAESSWSALLVDSALLVLLISLYRDVSPVETLLDIYSFFAATFDAISAWISTWTASRT